MKTPDGYDMCPACGHNTCQAVAGICTVFDPAKVLALMDGAPVSPYCGCDCYKAIHGISLLDKVFGKGKKT